MNISFCPNCKERSRLDSFKNEETVEVRGDAIEVEVEYFKCSNCGEEISSFDGKDEMAEAFKIYRSKHNLLRPEEIKAFRKSYGLTQGEISKLLGVSVATLSRYENGALQDKVHDNLLKMAMEPKSFIRLIKESEGVFSDEKKKALIEKASSTSNDVDDRNPETFAARIFSSTPSEFNGFRKFDMNRFEQAVLFLVAGGVSKTKLNKLLFYIDMKCYKENAAPITGVTYYHLPHGPVPDRYEFLLGVMVDQGRLKTEEREYLERYDLYHPACEADLSLFSKSERKILKLVKDHFQTHTAKQIRDYSHEEDAYTNTSDNEPISFSFATSLSI